jgi:DNA repair exonuclease SbcCD nuclease subunit
MFTFLHAADLHLDSPMHKLEAYEGAPVEELRHATRRALENLVRLAVSEGVAFVVVAGDLYDGDWRDYNTGLHFTAQMGKLRDAGIPVFLVSGNHDAASRITRTLRLPEGVHLFPSDRPDTLLLDDPEVAVHGQSFASPAVRKDLAAGYPGRVPGRFNVGLLHTCATGREGHEPYAPCSLETLRDKGYDYWALGHVHRREVLLEEPLVVFPGNTQGRHVRETGAKGCVAVSVDDRGRARASFRPLDAARWFVEEIDASEAAGGYDVIDGAAERFEALLEENPGLPLVVRVRITGASPAHEALASDVEQWTNEVRAAALETGGGRIFVEKVQVRTRTPATAGTGAAASGPVRELLRVLDEIGSDPEALVSLGGVLDDLQRKLPRELREVEGAPAPDDPDWVRAVLDQVRPMLVRRLVREERSE